MPHNKQPTEETCGKLILQYGGSTKPCPNKLPCPMGYHSGEPRGHTTEETLDNMVRDFCSVVPRPKSEVRRRIETALDIAYEEGRESMQIELKDLQAMTAYSEGYEAGKREVVENMEHEQRKLLDGFAHPEDCKICASLSNRDEYTITRGSSLDDGKPGRIIFTGKKK